MRCFVIVMFLFVSNYVYSATRAEIKLWLDAKDGIMQGQIDSIQYTETDPWTLNHGDINQSDGQQVQLYRNQTLVPFNGSRTINQNQWVKIIGLTNCGIDDFQVTGEGAGDINAFCSPLPVTWSSTPIAKIKNNQINLSWLVANQINNDKYIIEHSKDDRSLSPIGEIDGDGTNNEERHYSFTHSNPSIGVNYYRIKQMDYDGQYSYSNIASVVYEGDYSEIAIYPNPATNEVKIYIPNNTNLTITDIYGRTAKTLSIIEGENSIDIKELPSGFYIFALGDRKYRVLKE